MGILDSELQALKAKPNLKTYHQSSWPLNHTEENLEWAAIYCFRDTS